MKTRITITIETDDALPLAAGKAAHAMNVIKERLADYQHAAYISVLGPDGMSFEPDRGGCSEQGDDAYMHVNIKEVD